MGASLRVQAPCRADAQKKAIDVPRREHKKKRGVAVAGNAAQIRVLWMTRRSLVCFYLDLSELLPLDDLPDEDDDDGSLIDEPLLFDDRPVPLDDVLPPLPLPLLPRLLRHCENSSENFL